MATASAAGKISKHLSSLKFLPATAAVKIL